MKKSQKNRKMILVAFIIVIEIMLNACGKENEQVVNNQGKHAEYEEKLEDKREIDLDFNPALIKNTVTIVPFANNYGGYLTLKYGANGAVTTAYSETVGGKATATGSAQLVPYEVDGNITKAWLYTALKPKGRDPFGVLLFLSIEGNPLTLLVGMQTSTATMENSVEIP